MIGRYKCVVLKKSLKKSKGQLEVARKDNSISKRKRTTGKQTLIYKTLHENHGMHVGAIEVIDWYLTSSEQFFIYIQDENI